MLLFSYERGPAHQYRGESQRKIVAIDMEGFVYRKRFVVGYEDEARFVVIGICNIERIKQVLLAFKERIEVLPEHVNVGSFDGSICTFRFMEKMVYAQNLRRHDLDYEMNDDRARYDKYKAHMVASNTLLDLLDALAWCVYEDVPELWAALRNHSWIQPY